MTTKKPKIMKPNKEDCFQTPDYALDYLMPYLDTNMTVLEPACGNGNLVHGLQNRRFKRVYCSDIKNGVDFLTYGIPKDVDIIITNPPFSIKNKFMEKCCASGLPFALLLPASVFDSIDRRRMMRDNGMSIIIPDRRINFETPNHEQNKREGKKVGGAWFFSLWAVKGICEPNRIYF